MRKFLVVVFVIGLMIVPLAIFGCKGKVQEADTSNTATTEATVPTEEVVVTQAPVTEPAPAQQAVSQEAPPSAAMPQTAAPAVAATDRLAHTPDIQTALKAAGFYTGNVDGKIGPKTKKAVMEFQKTKGLKADGKVGPKTWAELEKYLKQ
jgi:peptidoglycan hydrolase-like protein with peptidoglycan-binding domain